MVKPVLKYNLLISLLSAVTIGKVCDNIISSDQVRESTAGHVLCTAIS